MLTAASQPVWFKFIWSHSLTGLLQFKSSQERHKFKRELPLGFVEMVAPPNYFELWLTIPQVGCISRRGRILSPLLLEEDRVVVFEFGE